MVFVDLWNIVCQNYDTTGSNCHFCSYETLFAKITTKQDQNVIFGGNIAKADVREPSNPAELANIVDKYLTNIFGSRRNSSKNEQSTQLSWQILYLASRRERQFQQKVWKYAVKQITKVGQS